MDSLSHALIGIAVAGLSGQPLSASDPVYIATILGAQAPDFDIIAHLKGSLAYLRQHRAFSHSIAGLAIWSFLIASGIHLFMPLTNTLLLFGWAFAGGLSHVLIDYFNTHGTAILWPFQKVRKSCHLLNVFDPVLLVLMLSPFGYKLTITHLSMAIFATIFLYIISRLYFRHRAAKWLNHYFDDYQIARIAVMPSLKRIFFWDFVLETENRYFIGQIGALYPVLEIKTTLPKQTEISDRTAEAQKTPIGDFFSTFTPFIYYEEQQEINAIKVNIYDLRYIINKQFIHSATIFFGENNIPYDSYMQSYGRKIKVPC